MRGFILFLAFSLSPVGWADEPPAEHFAKRIEFHDAVLSPGGDYIAVQRSADEGKKLVAIIGVEDLSLLGHIPAGSDYSPFKPFWVNDERLIVQLTQDLANAEFEYANGELLAIDFNGKKQRKIIEHQIGISTNERIEQLNALHGFATVVHRLPEEKNHVLIEFVEFPFSEIGDKPSLYRIHATRGTVTRVADAPTYDASFVFSPSGALQYSIGLDESALKSGMNKWVTHRYKDKEWQPLSELDIDTGAFKIISSGGSSDVYLKLGYRDKPDRIYRYDLESGERQLVFAHGEVDPSALDIDRKTGELVAVHFDDGLPNLHLVDEDHVYSQWYPALFQAFGGQRVRITSSSDDGKLLLVHVSGDKEPGQFRLFNTETRDMQYLFNSASWIDAEQMAATRPISFEARDGLKIHGYLTEPSNVKQAAPLVVMPHGGPFHVKDRWRFNPEVQFLASRGYAVLQLNFRGSGGYGWGFTESGYGKWGSEIQFDIIDGTRWAAAQDSIDGERICIIGSSFGGYSALMAPTIATDLYRCAAGVVGVYNLELMWNTADIGDTRSGRNYLQKAIGNDPESLKKNSPLYNINKLKIPVFLAHGKRDWRVDVKHFEQMVDALEKKRHPHETFLAKKEGHGFFSEENQLEYLRRLEAFLDAHIGEK